jgi:poly(3-hydroxybutyrate) depolymerase
MLSGIGSTARSVAEDFGWREEADRNGFLVVFLGPLPKDPDLPISQENSTFWESGEFQTHAQFEGHAHIDDEGYLMAVRADVLDRDRPDVHRIFFAGFSSGSAMVQPFAADHPRDVTAICAVATPLLHPPPKLARPVAVLYIHGDDDGRLYGLGPHDPHFATTPHGNWLIWGYLDGCHVQTAQSTDWDVEFAWRDCRHNVPVIADFVAQL